MRLDGDDVARVPPYRRHVNTVFQSYALFDHLDVEDNVAFGCAGARWPSRRCSGAWQRRSSSSRSTSAPGRGRTSSRAASATRRPGARARQPPVGAPARRAARRARPPAAQADADRAQAHPARGRDHVRLRDPRPGGGARDVGPHRGHARRRGPAAGPARGDLRAAREGVRGGLHRDLEPAARDRGGRRRADLHRRAGGRAGARRARPTAARCSSPSGPRSCGSTSSRTAWRRSRASSRSASTSAPRRSSSSSSARAPGWWRWSRTPRGRARRPLGARRPRPRGWRPEHAQVLR